MDISIEKVTDCSLGSLFQQIINDMKVSAQLTYFFGCFMLLFDLRAEFAVNDQLNLLFHFR